MSTNTEIIFQRSPHDKENPYAQISRHLIRDSSISPSCRWMLMYFLSMRDDFSIKIKQLCDHVQPFIGRDSVYDLLAEAIEAGYMKREDKYRGNLKAGCIYYISEAPVFKKCFRHPDPQYTEARGPENQEALRKSLKKEELKKETTTPTPSKGKSESETSQPLEKYGKFVQMKKEEHQELVSVHGELVIKELVEEMNDYLAASGNKPYKDYAAAIRQWVKRRKNTPQPNSFSKTTSPEIDRELAHKVRKMYSHIPDIEFGDCYIEFNCGVSNRPHLKFGDKFFRENVLKYLNKFKLPTEGL